MSRKIPQAPHSWSLNRWPADVYPNESSRARYLVRSNRAELVSAGVLSRVGRELIVFGDRYSRWLELKAANVPGFECGANRSKTGAAG